jgi:hypothetical protein
VSGNSRRSPRLWSRTSRNVPNERIHNCGIKLSELYSSVPLQQRCYIDAWLENRSGII